MGNNNILLNLVGDKNCKTEEPLVFERNFVSMGCSLVLLLAAVRL